MQASQCYQLFISYLYVVTDNGYLMRDGRRHAVVTGMVVTAKSNKEMSVPMADTLQHSLFS